HQLLTNAHAWHLMRAASAQSAAFGRKVRGPVCCTCNPSGQAAFQHPLHLQCNAGPCAPLVLALCAGPCRNPIPESGCGLPHLGGFGSLGTGAGHWTRVTQLTTAAHTRVYRVHNNLDWIILAVLPQPSGANVKGVCFDSKKLCY